MFVTKKSSFRNLRIKTKKIKFGKGGKGDTSKGSKGGGTPAPQGGGISAPASPPTILEHCKSVRVYTNVDGDNPTNRTVSVHQVLGAGWPPGSTITVWTGDPNQEGNPPDVTNGSPFPISKQGEDVTRAVKKGESIYVHYKKPDDSNIATVNALISTS